MAARYLEAANEKATLNGRKEKIVIEREYHAPVAEALPRKTSQSNADASASELCDAITL